MPPNALERAEATIGPIEPRGALARALGRYGGALEAIGDAGESLGDWFAESPLARSILIGNALRTASSGIKESGEAFKDWSLGFAPIRSTGNLSQPRVDREQLAALIGGAPPGAAIARAVPGAVKHAARDFADATVAGLPRMAAARTPTLKEFFGDWSRVQKSISSHEVPRDLAHEAFKKHGVSRVVNDDFTPQVVYHGTQQKFDEFSLDPGVMANPQVRGDNVYGPFFTTSRGEAERYSRGGYYSKDRTPGAVKTAYLNIRNPYQVGRSTDILLNKFKSHAEAKEWLVSQGYDGLKIDVGKDRTWWVPFNAEQIRHTK